MSRTFTRKIAAATLAIGMGFASVVSAQADSYARWICIENAGESEIVSVIISDVDSKIWGRNLIRRDLIEVGDSMTLEPRRPNGYCRFDMQIEFADGEIQQIWDVNLCSVTNLLVDEFDHIVI